MTGRTDAADELTVVARELYAATPGEFVAARNAWAARHREAGEIELAAAVARLPKATAPAWAVCAVVREQPAQADELSQLGAELRVAQASANAPELRALSRRRRSLTSRATSAAEALAQHHGVVLSAAALTHVEGTWHAMVIDRAAEQAVRSGLLVRPLEPGAVDLTDALGVPGSVVPDDPPPDDDGEHPPSSTAAAARRAERDLQEAERVAAAARAEAAEAAEAVADLQAEVLRAAAEVEEARRHLDDREAALAALDERQDAAHEAHDAATARSEEAERAVTELRARASGHDA